MKVATSSSQNFSTLTSGNDSNESEDDNEKQVEERLKDDKSESKQNAEKEESLEDNFAFLSKRGMIAKDNISNSTESQ